MKLLLLLTALTFTFAFAEERVVMKVYTDSQCAEEHLYLTSSGDPMKLGCRDGRKYFVSGNDFKMTVYSTTDCSGTGGGTQTIGELNKCSNNQKMALMSEAAYISIIQDPKNLIWTTFTETDDCTGGTVNSISGISSAINGKCIQTGNTSAIMTWDEASKSMKRFGTSDCSGTATSVENEKLNVCHNSTNGDIDKQSNIYSVNLPTSSGTKLNGFHNGILYVTLCLGYWFNLQGQ